MTDTGIVRRIDDLGRVVIPREMRKTLRIKEGDPLEIFSHDEGLYLKKYSPVQRFCAFSESIGESLYENLQKTCIITDTDQVICAFPKKEKELIGKRISSELSLTLKERKSLLLNKEDGANFLPVIDKESLEVSGQIVVPIISNGDCFGSVIVLDNKEQKLDDNALKLTRLIASLLAKFCD